jgi:hypothetical protein
MRIRLCTGYCQSIFLRIRKTTTIWVRLSAWHILSTGANPAPSCIDILSDLAQLCARFSDLAPTSDGLRWCLQLDPTLLGDVQAQYQVGCFRMGPEGMSVDPPVNTSAQPRYGFFSGPKNYFLFFLFTLQYGFVLVNDWLNGWRPFFRSWMSKNFPPFI